MKRSTTMRLAAALIAGLSLGGCCQRRPPELTPQDQVRRAFHDQIPTWKQHDRRAAAWRHFLTTDGDSFRQTFEQVCESTDRWSRLSEQAE